MRLLTTRRFERDLRRSKRRGKNLDKLWTVRASMTAPDLEQVLREVSALAHRVCLRCRQPFASVWRGHRMCDACARTMAGDSREPL